jgi:magnesium transporter
MDVRWVTESGLERHDPDEIKALLSREDGFLWVDIPTVNDAEARILEEIFGFHPLAVRESREPSAVPKLYPYGDHFFVVLHGLEPGPDGGAYVVELDQFISYRYLVTIHAPHASAVPAEISARECTSVRRRIEAGRFLPQTPGELGHAIASSLARRLEVVVSSIAARIASLEHLVMKGDTRESSEVLDRMFRVRHELLTVRTISAQTREVYARMAAFSEFLEPRGNVWVVDLLDQFDRLKNMCDGEKELLQEVLDFHQTRIADELNEFVRRLTSVGAILVVCTLVAGIYGMNFQHMPELGWQLGYLMALGIMAVLAVLMAIYFRRRGWL